MNGLRRFASDRSGMIFHAISSILIFFIWRITGMPSPGLLGRLVPLSWMITALVYGRGGIPRLSVYLLAVFTVSSLFWTADPGFEVISAACGLMGIFPGLQAISSRKFGIVLAVLPLIPMILLLVPFTGDEPHYASITEDLISTGTGRFSAFSTQAGDPLENFSHHQSLYPALMIPGYVLSVPGLRGMNILFAMAALLLISMIFRDSGLKNWRQLTVLGFLLVPGCGILGLVYPGWLAMAVFLAAVYASIRSKRSIWVIAAAIILILIKIRFIGISIGLLAALVIESKGRRKLILPVALVCLAVAGLLFDLVILDGRIFWVRYGNMDFVKVILLQPLYRTPEILIAAASSLVDIESGLLWKAPWVLAGLAGLPLLKKENSKLFIWLGLPALIYFLVLIYWTTANWSGMPTPAGRMLLPLLPVLLASLAIMMKRKGVRILVWASLAISAVLFTYPLLRFNHADGTDALVSRIFGHFSNVTEWVPSAVRFCIPLFAGWIVVAVVMIILLARKSRYTEYFFASAFLVFCLFGGLEKKSWEAEDLPSEYRNFCSIYPDETDPESRVFWFFSRERMLRMSSPDDAVILPLPETEQDSLKLTILHRSFRSGPPAGIEVSCGEWRDSVYASSEVMEAPQWAVIMKDIQLSSRPENLREIRTEFIIPVSDCADSIRIAPLGVEGGNSRFRGIYLDRILFR
ncbi:MAG: hypothetical protein GQ565_04270 [Candidatus Aegiribacteria sp.]|nr:hypothetical protein [Candidatus Aegiribacteria sp.]